MNAPIIRHSITWLFSALFAAEQLWICVFFCAFIHVHAGNEHSHASNYVICCQHSSGRCHAAEHEHNLPAADELRDSERELSDDKTVPVRESLYYWGRERDCRITVFNADYGKDIPFIQKHNMRC